MARHLPKSFYHHKSTESLHLYTQVASICAHRVSGVHLEWLFFSERNDMWNLSNLGPAILSAREVLDGVGLQ